MKTYIDTRWYDSEDLRDIIKERLNSAGFYCISLEHNGLDIYAIEERAYFEEKVIAFFKFLWGKIWSKN